VLDRVIASLGADGTGQLCIVCGAPAARVPKASRGEVFSCPNDHYEPRCYLFDGKAKWSVEDGRLVHESAGALVRRDQETLLFKRTRYPLGWTIPAGHVEEGCDPADEMRRELEEEVGLRAGASRRVWREAVLLEDACRRGADWHRWHLFEVEPAPGDVRLGDEGSEFAWEDENGIRAMAGAGLLVPPVRRIFERLGVVQPRPPRAAR